MLPTPIHYRREEQEGKPLLLHVCCGPCATGCIDPILEMKREIILLFSNSNLDTAEEFQKRLDSVKIVAGHWNLELLVDEYRHGEWLKSVSEVPHYREAPERGARCAACFAWQLGRAAKYAEQIGCGFTTTLTVSPYKNTAMIHEAGSVFSSFEAWNFKKGEGYKRSLQYSAELGLYRQKYCGCEFSLASLQDLNNTANS